MRRRWWEWTTRRPVVARRDQVARATGCYYIGCSVISLSIAAVTDGSASVAQAYWLVGLIVLALGVAVLSAPSLLAPWVHHALMVIGGLIGAIVVVACGSPVLAVSFSVMFAITITTMACVGSWGACGLHLAFYLACLVSSLSRVPGVTSSAIVIAAGSLVLVPGIVGYLARANAIAEIDALTELPNRRGLHRHLRAAMAESEESGAACVVALVHFDHFTAVNDAGGRIAGDRLLRSTATWSSACGSGRATRWVAWRPP